MYVDQETVQDDEENNKTGTNRPPSPATDVSLCKMKLYVSFDHETGFSNYIHANTFV